VLDLYTKIKKGIDDKSIQNILDKILVDEKEHIENIKKILKLV
jgi:rubrerythrin